MDDYDDVAKDLGLHVYAEAYGESNPHATPCGHALPSGGVGMPFTELASHVQTLVGIILFLLGMTFGAVVWGIRLEGKVSRNRSEFRSEIDAVKQSNIDHQTLGNTGAQPEQRNPQRDSRQAG